MNNYKPKLGSLMKSVNRKTHMNKGKTIWLTK